MRIDRAARNSGPAYFLALASSATARMSSIACCGVLVPLRISTPASR